MPEYWQTGLRSLLTILETIDKDAYLKDYKRKVKAGTVIQPEGEKLRVVKKKVERERSRSKDRTRMSAKDRWISGTGGMEDDERKKFLRLMGVKQPENEKLEAIAHLSMKF